MFKRIHRVKQHDHSDCAAACIASVAAHFGLKMPIARIRQFAATDETGTNLFGLIKAANELGFDAKGIRAEAGHLRSIPTPAIAHTLIEGKLGHFVVIYRVRRRSLKVMDPGDGCARTIGYEVFREQWTGVLVLLIPGNSFTPQKLQSSGAVRFYNLIKPHRTLLIEALVGAVFYTLLGLSTALYVQKIIDDVLPSRNRNLLDLMSLAMVALTFIQISFSIGKSFILLRVGQKIDSQLVIGYYEHLLHLPQSFFGTMRVGELISRVGDAIKIRVFISDSSVDLLINILIVLLSLSLMGLYSPELAIVAGLMIPAFAVIYIVTNRLNRSTQRELMASSAKLETHLVESIGAMATIKQFALERHEIRKTESSLLRLLMASYSSTLNTVLSSGASFLAVRIITIAVLWHGAGLVIEQTITPGELMSFYALFGYLAGPAFGLITMNRTIQDALIAADRLYEIMDLEREAVDGQIELKVDVMGDVSFESVCFHYGSDREVLSNLSLTIKVPSFTAIVGKSGSGKSTLIALLQRTCHPTRGSIRIGEIDLRYISEASLRRRVALVPQQVVLFAGDIVDNVAVGEDSPDLASVFRACKLSGIATFIDGLPMKYQTPIGENGLSLSGGQRQAIAIARALYRRPDILILDEATSSLDACAERSIKQLIGKLRREGMAIIVIAHRLSTVVDADEIVVLGEGRVQEVGNHQSLIQQEGVYHELWTNQFTTRAITGTEAFERAPLPGWVMSL